MPALRLLPWASDFSSFTRALATGVFRRSTVGFTAALLAFVPRPAACSRGLLLVGTWPITTTGLGFAVRTAVGAAGGRGTTRSPAPRPVASRQRSSRPSNVGRNVRGEVVRMAFSFAASRQRLVVLFPFHLLLRAL